MKKPLGLIRGAGAGSGGPAAKRVARAGDLAKNGQAQHGLRVSAEVANICCDRAHQRRYACVCGPNLRAHADLTGLNPAPSAGLN